MHPLTPAIRSWQAVVVVVAVIVQELGRQAASGEVHLRPGADAPSWLLAGGGAVVVVLLGAVVGLMYVSWRFTRYRVTDRAVELRHGVLSRHERVAPLDRLQSVDVVRPLLARMVGLARLTIEVAGGGDSRIRIGFLTEARAQALRNRILATAAGVSYETDEAPEAREEHLVEVPPGRLVASLLLSGATAGMVVTVGVLVVGTVLTREAGFVAGAVPAALSAAGVLWKGFSGGFGFRVARSADGLRLTHGLIEHRAQTVPPGRVQAVRVVQPLLWRRFDWWKVELNIAGNQETGTDKDPTRGVLLPVGTRDEAVGVLWAVLPDLGTGEEHPGLVLEAGLRGRDDDGGFTPSPARVRPIDPIGWRRNGFRVTRTAVLLRHGALRRRLDVVPHARTQSCGLRQGPLQRRFGVTSFALHSTPGPIEPVVRHLEDAVAVRLLEEQLTRARRAREAAPPERWMTT